MLRSCKYDIYTLQRIFRQIPNSPIWLLSRGRRGEAVKALAWFRGWAREADVLEEFADLERYVKTSLTYGQIADEENMALLGEGKFKPCK